MNSGIKLFKVAALSTNHNSFGLRQNLLVARDGYTVSALRSIAQEQWAVGQVIALPMITQDGCSWPDPWTTAQFGCECVEQLAKAPSKMIKHIWEAA